MGRGAHPRRDPHPARQPRVADRGRRPRPLDAGRHLLRLRQPLGLRRRHAWPRSATSGPSRSRAASPTGSATATRSMLPQTLSPERRARYSRHLLIPEIGEEGQLQAARLADPADRRRRPRLAGRRSTWPPPGVGHLGIIDADIVDESNLQRQIAHSLNTLGTPKVDSARRAIEALNPDVEVTTYRERLTSENIDRILDDGWEIIVDGADNFPTRYLVNDASVWRGIPVVHGSIYRFEGQVTVFKPGDGPCYRCLYASPPPPELAPSCAEGGVLGVLPGIVGHAADQRGAEAGARDRRAADRPAAALRRARDRLPGGAHQAQPGLPGLRRRTRRSPSTSTTSSSAPGRRAPVSVVRVPPVLRAGGRRRARARGVGRDGARAARGPVGARAGARRRRSTTATRSART